MTSSPSSSRFKPWSHSYQSLTLSLLVAAAPLLLATACADKHIGRPCMIGVTSMDPSVGSVNPQALECPSRICLLANHDSPPSQGVQTGPLCTDYCATDDDCADGEKRSDSNPNGCITGFACRTPFAKLETNPLSCKRLCVCKDFLKTNDPDVKPPSCP